MSEPQAKTLAEALLAAQQEMPAVDRDGTNPHFKSKFTTLDNLLAKVRPVLNRHNLVLVQAPVLVDGTPCLRTQLMHAGSNEALTTDAPLSAAKADPQGQGSAITYMRRYALAAALAIADQEDDDGNAATASESNGNGQRVAPSEGQLKFLKDLAIAAEFKEPALGSLLDWAEAVLTGGQGGSMSEAIDGLKDPDTRTATAKRLDAAASAWADQQMAAAEAK